MGVSGWSRPHLTPSQKHNGSCRPVVFRGSPLGGRPGELTARGSESIGVARDSSGDPLTSSFWSQNLCGFEREGVVEEARRNTVGVDNPIRAVPLKALRWGSPPSPLRVLIFTE